MTRQGLTRGFGLTGALALLVTATLHTVATPQINELATSLPGDSSVLLPLLFVAFGITLGLAGILTALVSVRAGKGDHRLLAVIALFPLAGAALQMIYIGFIAPTALLLLDGLLVLGTAGLARQDP